jgi:hypothetical protein
MKSGGILLFTSLIISSLLFSCIRENPYADKIRTLDSLYFHFDSLEKELLSINPAEAEKTYDEIMRNVDFVKKELKDTLDKESGFLMSDYRHIRKPFKRIKESYDSDRKELEFTKLQLYNLSKDLKKQLLEPEQAEEYFLTEFNAATSTEIQIKSLLAGYRMADNTFKELHPKVQELIEKRIIAEVK